MALIEEYESSGNWLFKNRSYIPVLLYFVATLTIYFDRTEFADSSNLIFSLICLAISLFGLFIRAYTIVYANKNTSGRNVKGQVADCLNTKGIYSIVRHPLYLGNFFMWFGIVIYVANFWIIITVILLFWIYYERIMFAEEGYLRNKFGEVYTNWALGTPAFLPSFKSWQKPESEFNIVEVIRREYYGFTAVGISFAYINFIKNYLYKGIFELDIFYSYLLALSIIVFVMLRFVKKKTKILK